MAAITFTEKSIDLLSKIYNVFDPRKSSEEQALTIAGFFVSGVPRAIAIYLKKKMMETADSTVELNISDLMKFTLTATKKGDSVALIPGFEMLPKGMKYIEADDVNFNVDKLEAFNMGINGNKELIEIAKNTFAYNQYNDDTDEWMSPSSDSPLGMEFNEESDIAIGIVTIIATIIDVLSNTKDSAAEIEYEVPGFGKFTVKPVKNAYEVRLTFDKEYKANSKSDKLAEKMASII